MSGKEQLVIGCYTAGDYEREANEHLLASVKELGLPYDIREIPNRGSWVLNNSACQIFVRRMHDEHPNADLLYIDVDGHVRSNPWGLLGQLECDVACYILDGRELLSGTVFLPAGPRRCELLTRWIDRNRQLPNIWDQVNLQWILHADPTFRFINLPAEYCCIFDLQRKRTPDIVPVIEHFQASRRYKKKVQKA